MVLLLFGYVGVGTLITATAFGRKLMALTFTLLRREGDLRFDLARTREHSGARAARERLCRLGCVCVMA